MKSPSRIMPPTVCIDTDSLDNLEPLLSMQALIFIVVLLALPSLELNLGLLTLQHISISTELVSQIKKYATMNIYTFSTLCVK
jgi:hypothetical protein